MSIVPSVETGTLALLFLEILWVFVSDDPFKETTVQVKNAVETLWTHKYSIQDGNASVEERVVRTGPTCLFIETNQTAIHAPYVENEWNDVTSNGSVVHCALQTLLQSLSKTQKRALNCAIYCLSRSISRDRSTAVSV